MGFVKKHFKISLFAAAICAAALLSGCSALDAAADIMGQGPKTEDLLARIPKMDASSYNRFLFSIDIIAGVTDSDSTEYDMTGALESYGSVSRLYGLEFTSSKSDTPIKAESWADFWEDVRYTDTGGGFAMDGIKNSRVLDNLVAAVNSRGDDITLSSSDAACTLSWTFPADVDYLFGDIIKQHSEDGALEGTGRVTAVFSPQTYEFEYFTFVISAGNSKKAYAMLDAVFYWKVRNGDDVLKIPDSISCDAYETATGVSTNGGYDEMVNPLAEEFKEAYGGTAEVMHHDGGASMFWTKAEEGSSVTVSVMKDARYETMYDESLEFFGSFYGGAAEESEDSSYFYNEATSELIYIAKGNGYISEIVVTGKPGATQGELRKLIITYQSRLGM